MRGRAARIESRAIVVAAIAFLLVFLADLLVGGLAELPLSGPGSIGAVASIGAGVLAVGGYLAGSRSFLTDDSPGHRVGGRWRWVLDLIALSIAHGLIALIASFALFTLLQEAFIGAVVYPLAGAVLAGAVGAIAAYFSFLSSSHMSAFRLAAVVEVFLVCGVLTSMLTASDPDWWRYNLSTLGINEDVSAWAFNITLLIAGLIVTTIASYATRDLEARALAADDPRLIGKVRVLQTGLAAIGILLACVGLFPTDEWTIVHNTVAIGMLVIFAVLIVSIRALVPLLPSTFIFLGFGFLAVIVVSTVLFITGYYNLTALELIAASLIFVWLIILIRNIGAVEGDQADASLHADAVAAGVVPGGSGATGSVAGAVRVDT